MSKETCKSGIGETIVFQFDTAAQRKKLFDLLQPYMFADSGIRVSAMSVDHEIRRLSLIEEALEQDDCDLRDAIEDIIGCPDLSQWSWDKYLDGETP